MTLEANVLRDNPLRVVTDGYELDVHLAWYRSLPFSCIEQLKVVINGVEIPAEKIFLCHQGQRVPFSELQEMTEDWWFVQDALSFHLDVASPAGKNTEADLSVSLATRIPYIIIGPNFPLVQRTDVSKKVTIL